MGNPIVTEALIVPIHFSNEEESEINTQILIVTKQ